MKKLLLIAALTIGAAAQFISAQVNGTAVVPTVSTLESPVYYYIESAADATYENYNNPQDLRGNVLICPAIASNIRWGTLTELNKDSALWAIVNVGGTIKLVNKAIPTFFMTGSYSVDTTGEAFYYVARTSPNQLQYILNTGANSKTLAWNNNLCNRQGDIGPNSKTSWFFLQPFAAERTVNVSSSTPSQGTAVITGTSLTTKTSQFGISITANPVPGNVFVNWTKETSGEIISTESPYNVGDNSINLIADYANLGTVGKPFVSTSSEPIYYYLQSASDGSHQFKGYGRDFRSNLIISPTTAGRLIHNRITAATTPDHALWMLEDVAGTILLKNKATGFYMVGSRDAGTTTTGNGFTPALQGSNQYTIKTADAGTPNTSMTNTWKSNLCDRLYFATDPGENSLISWYFVVAPESLTNYQNALIISGVSDVNKDEYRISTVNRVITVEGVTDFEIYSVTGQKQNRDRALQSGAYFVKIGNFTQKVMVK